MTDRKIIARAVKLLDVNRLHYALAVVYGVMTLVCTVGLSAVSSWLIARASQLPLVSVLSLAATIVRAFGASKPVFRYFRQIESHRVALDGMSTLRASVYNALADSRIDHVTAIRRGDLLARTGRDISAVGDLIVRALLPMHVALWASLVTTAIIAYFSPAIALAVAACLATSAAVGPAIARRGALRAERDQVTDRAEISALAMGMLDAADELRISGRLDAMNQALRAAECKVYANRDAAALPAAIASVVDTLCTAAAVLFALVIGSQEVAAGSLAPVELAIVTLLPLAAFEATQPLAAAAIQAVRSAAAARRIFELIDGQDAAPTHDSEAGAAPSDDDSNNTVPGDVVPGSVRPSDVVPNDAEHAPRLRLEARDLVIGWPGGPDVAGPLTLSFTPGESVAIIGPSGIGKTTLLYTLAGLLQPHAGSVTLDGAPVAGVPREDVSRYLVVTAEDAHVFATTILENLRVARADLTEAEASELLDACGLGEWLSGLPDGVHTLIGSNAGTVSGGERRRLLLARALASKAEILLLDEPGEHLDTDTADALVRDLLRAGAATDHPRTVILVTHRLTPLDAADRIVLLGSGPHGTEVRAQGTHKELASLVPDYTWSLGQEEA